MISKLLFSIFISFCAYGSTNTLDSDPISPDIEKENEFNSGFIKGDKLLPNYNSEKYKNLFKETLSGIRDKVNESGIGDPLINSKDEDRVNSSKKQDLISDNVKTSQSSVFRTDNVKSDKSKLITKKKPISSVKKRYVFKRGKEEKKETEGFEMGYLASGSTALVTFQSGLNVAEEESEDINGTIDAVFLGPNKSEVKLNGCNIWVAVNGKYRDSRIRINKDSKAKITCVPLSLVPFTVEAEVQVKDQYDEQIGILGELNLSNQRRAALISGLNSGIKAFAGAISAGQVTQTVTSNDGGLASSSNITGSSSRYATANAIQQATGSMLDNVNNLYNSMRATISLGAGSQAFIIIKDTVKIPKVFLNSSNESTFKAKKGLH